MKLAGLMPDPAEAGQVVGGLGDPAQYRFAWTRPQESPMGATGRVWHLPVAAARTTRGIVGQVYALAGRRPRILAAGRTMLRLIGVVNPAMREYRHTLCQFSER